MNINFDSYKVFYSVAKNKNITKAAHELLISQPGVSKTIKNLEEQLDCTLFIRSKTGVTLTEEGQVFYNEIKRAMELINNAEHKLLEVLNLESGVLNIGISNTLTQKYLLPFIEKFHELYPKVKIKIHTDMTKELIIKNRAGIVDFIILNLPYDLPNDFYKEELATIHDCFIANNKFQNLKDKTIPFDSLNNYPLILLAKGSNTRTFLDNFTLKQNLLLIPEMEPASNQLVVEFAKIGLGIGYTIKEFIQEEINSQKLFEIKTDLKIPSRSIGLIYHKNQVLNKASNAFISLLKNNSKIN